MTPPNSFRFDSSKRLKKGWEFDAVFRTGRQHRGALVRLYYLDDRAGAPRVGVTAGKKIANAVGRAGGRRVLREAARRLLPWVNDGVWLILSMRERGLDKSAVSIYLDVAKSLRQAGLLKPDWGGPDWFVDRR